MLKLPLKISSFAKKSGFPWKATTPFVDNSRAQLIHRPYSVTTFHIHREPHTAVHYWCGNCSSYDLSTYTFLDTLDGKKLICARCEKAAVLAGLPSSDELLGHHAHKGRLVAVKTCCMNIPAAINEANHK